MKAGFWRLSVLSIIRKIISLSVWIAELTYTLVAMMHFSHC